MIRLYFKLRDDTSRRIQTVTVVYPGEADISQDKTSALTPIRAGLPSLGKRGPTSLKRLTVLEMHETQTT
jgi:regulator of nucleoside diphosphate kinase